jgi:hypothetical protein
VAVAAGRRQAGRVDEMLNRHARSVPSAALRSRWIAVVSPRLRFIDPTRAPSAVVGVRTRSNPWSITCG